jgi:hypothetical protein
MSTAKSRKPKQAAEGELQKMMVAEQVLIVSAPAGPRRRAGLSFGPEPREIRQDELGSTSEEIGKALDALRGDPLLKLDGRWEEFEADDADEATDPDGNEGAEPPAD